MSYTAKYFVNKLKLQAHPEGGYFSESYRAEEVVSKDGLPSRFKGDRHLSTAIYFLIEGKQYSAFHRIKSDEVWHFYYGIPLLVYIIHPDGTLESIKVGNDLEAGCVFQGTVKAGCWFASKPINERGFSLVGCTVSPGFDFDDFELATKELINDYPQHAELIKSFLPEVS